MTSRFTLDQDALSELTPRVRSLFQGDPAARQLFNAAVDQAVGAFQQVCESEGRGVFWILDIGCASSHALITSEFALRRPKCFNRCSKCGLHCLPAVGGKCFLKSALGAQLSRIPFSQRSRSTTLSSTAPQDLRVFKQWEQSSLSTAEIAMS
jgi:hypothetical protein